jgi:stage II sporulation protein AA (anti-sigma F factor antagonist)
VETIYQKEDKSLILKITEELDHHTVEKIRRKADYEIEKYIPRRVILDFNQVSFMDSAGIGLLIGRYKLANMLGGKVQVANMTSPVRKIFEMSGMQRIIPEIKSKTEPAPNAENLQNGTGTKCT